MNFGDRSRTYKSNYIPYNTVGCDCLSMLCMPSAGAIVSNYLPLSARGADLVSMAFSVSCCVGLSLLDMANGFALDILDCVAPAGCSSEIYVYIIYVYTQLYSYLMRIMQLVLELILVKLTQLKLWQSGWLVIRSTTLYIVVDCRLILRLSTFLPSSLLGSKWDAIGKYQQIFDKDNT